MAAGAPEGGHPAGHFVRPADLHEAMGMHGEGWKSVRPSANDSYFFHVLVMNFNKRFFWGG